MREIHKIQGYKGLRHLIDGPFWALYEAIDSYSEQRQLLQILNPEFCDETVFEVVHSQTSLDQLGVHPNILIPNRFSAIGKLHILFYDFFNGQSLRELLDSHIPIVERRAVSIVKQCATALQYAQIRGMEHGWFCPEYILISKFSDEIKLFGFGSRQLFDYLGQHYSIYSIHGFPYSPPENLMSGDFEADDTYALGTLFYELLTGRLPYQSDSDYSGAQKRKLIPPIVLNPKISTSNSDLAISMVEEAQERRVSLNYLLNLLDPREEDVSLEGESVSNTQASTIQRIRDFTWRLTPFGSNIVGSKKRIAYAALTGIIFVILILSIIIISHISSMEERRFQKVYDEFITETVSDSRQGNDLYAFESDDEITTPENEASLSSQSDNKPQIEIEQDHAGSDVSSEGDQNIATDAEMTPLQVDHRLAAMEVLAFYRNNRIEANVSIGGKFLGQTTPTTPFYFGNLKLNKVYTLRVYAEGFETWKENLTFDKQDTFLYEIEMVPSDDQRIEFTFAALAFADRVAIDSDSNFYRLPYSTSLAAGTYQLFYVDSKSDFIWKTTLQLDESSPRTVEINADAVGRGEALIVIDNAIQFGYAFVKIDDESTAHTTPFRTQLSAGWHRVSIYRENFTILPSDTMVFIKPQETVNIRAKVLE